MSKIKAIYIWTISMFLCFLLACLSVQTLKVNAETEVIYLNEYGWSQPVGNWDPVTLVATLTQNITADIIIDYNGITLDGNGFSITGDGTGKGVSTDTHGYLTIKNLTISNKWSGIMLTYGYDSLIENNIVSNCDSAIYLYEARRNNVVDNEVFNTVWGIHLRELADDNLIESNYIHNNTIGLDIEGSFTNIIRENLISQNTNYGAYITISLGVLNPISDHNRIYHNNFVNNSAGIWYTAGSDNKFYMDLPIGGNYWSLQSYSDENHDGFMDYPYSFFNGQDLYPYAVYDGWVIKDADKDGVADDVDIAPNIYNPSQDGSITGVLGIFDQAVVDNQISGIKTEADLIEFRLKLVEVQEKISIDETHSAIRQLKNTLRFMDGESQPKDLINGVGLSDLEALLNSLLNSFEL